MSNLRKNLTFYLLIFFTVSFLISASKNALRYIKMKKEIDRKEVDLTKKIEENEELKKQLISFSKEDMERLIRDKLSMAKEGETIIILENELLPPDEENTVEKSRIDDNKTNWQKWLALFVKKEGDEI